MIAYLNGKLAYLNRDSLVLDLNGVGYELKISERTSQTLQAHPADQPLQVTTHLVMREEGPELFGFLSQAEKDLFLMLTRVSSVGPRIALNIFSALSLEEIIKAIVGNQPKVLSSAPGIGAKTAQRIILELREKLSKLQISLPLSPDLASTELPVDWIEEIELTLLALSYTPEEVQRVLLDQGQILKEQTHVDDAIRLLLSQLDHQRN